MDGNERMRQEATLRNRVIAVFGRTDERTFDEVCRDYRNIEADCIAESVDDPSWTTDVKRTVRTYLLMEAEREQQPHEVCHAIWLECVELDFWNINMRHVTTSRFARCCRFNGEFDAGIAVLEPLITELETLLDRSELTASDRRFCEENLGFHKKLRADLLAHSRG